MIENESSDQVFHEQTFLWGTATSGHQVDGDNKHSDWWAWESEGAIDGGVRSGQAADHIQFFREDLQRAKSLGLNSYRFSFEWARLEPSEGNWDTSVFEWYDQLLLECESLELVPMATLHHFTLPNWMAEQGGFSSVHAAEKFLKFVARVIERYGSRIPLWCTINEPMVLVAGSYLGRFMPPGEFDPQGASRACFQLLKAHVLSYDLIHLKATKREGPFAKIPLQVGFAHNMLDFGPERVWHPIERIIASTLAKLYNDSWLKAVSGEKQKFGLYGVFPFAPQVQAARGRRTYDFIGLNYYTRAYVQWRPRAQSKEQLSILPIGLSFARRKDVASDLGWAIHPSGLAKILQNLARYRAPIYITENGIADASDQYRTEYLRLHLLEVAKAKEDGVDIRGYYHWSLIDNFEWIKGFWPRFGLFSVNYETMERLPRGSAQFLRDLIKAHNGNRAPSSDVLRKF